MATVLEECITEEQRSVVRFLWAKELNAKDIHKQMFPVYGGKCLSRSARHSWVDKFSQRRRPVTITTEGTAQRVEELIRADRRKTTDSVATALGCSDRLVQSTMHERLKFRKVFARWMPRELIEGSRNNEPNGSVLASSLMICR
jgi:hypothetical protein